MSTFERYGNPFPLSHPLFSSDRALVAKVRTFNIYVEMLDEYKYSKYLITKLQSREFSSQLSGFGKMTTRIEGIFFSHALLEYARSFVSSEGSTNLISKQTLIFTDEKTMGMHKFLMKLRDKFLAHRQLNANHNQSRFLRDEPKKGDLKLLRDEQRFHLALEKTVKLPLFENNIEMVLVFLKSTLDSLEESIISGLSEQQREYLLRTDQKTLKDRHEMDDNQSALAPFGIRKRKS